jgi:hypothetical protein
MSLTLILAIVAIAILGLVGFVLWFVRQPLPGLVVSKEVWERINKPDYWAWRDANPDDRWVMAAGREDGDYHLSFMSRGAARRFGARWLKDVPNQASLTHQSRSGTGI